MIKQITPRIEFLQKLKILFNDKMYAESLLKQKYEITETKVGETPKSNYYAATKKGKTLEDPARVVKIVSLSNIVPKNITPMGAVREVTLKLKYWKELARKHCHIMGIELIEIDSENQRLKYVPVKFMPYSLYDWIRRKNKNNVKLNKSMPKDKDVIMYAQKNFISFASTVLSVLTYLHNFGLSSMNLKTENILVRCNSLGFSKMYITDLFLINSSKDDRNQLFKNPDIEQSQESAAADGSDSYKHDIYALGMILYELSTCQIIEKPRSISKTDDLRSKVLSDLDKDESIEAFQKKIISYCLMQDDDKDGSIFGKLELMLVHERSRMVHYEEIGLGNLKHKKESIAVINKENLLDTEFGPLLSSTNKRELLASKVDIRRSMANNSQLLSFIDDRSSRLRLTQN